MNEVQIRELGRKGAPAVAILQAIIPTERSVQRLAASLLPEYRVLLVAAPGYGESARFSPFTWQGMRARLLAALKKETASRLVLLAHSLGTYHALSLALDGSLGVSGLFLLGAVAGLDQVSRDAYAQLGAFAAADREAVKRMYVDTSFEPGFLDAHPQARAEFLECLDAGPWDWVIEQLKAFTELPDLRPKVRTLSIPVTVRTGAHDQATPIELSRDIVTRIHGAVLEEIPNSRHFALFDDEEATHRSIHGFLKATFREVR